MSQNKPVQKGIGTVFHVKPWDVRRDPRWVRLILVFSLCFISIVFGAQQGDGVPICCRGLCISLGNKAGSSAVQWWSVTSTLLWVLRGLCLSSLSVGGHSRASAHAWLHAVGHSLHGEWAVGYLGDGNTLWGVWCCFFGRKETRCVCAGAV